MKEYEIHVSASFQGFDVNFKNSLPISCGVRSFAVKGTEVRIE